MSRPAGFMAQAASRPTAVLLRLIWPMSLFRASVLYTSASSTGLHPVSTLSTVSWLIWATATPYSPLTMASCSRCPHRMYVAFSHQIERGIIGEFELFILGMLFGFRFQEIPLLFVFFGLSKGLSTSPIRQYHQPNSARTYIFA